MTMKPPESTERTIQRLVDNQLGARARREFLLAADQQPELWRRAALAFVEEQVWKATIPSAATEPVRVRESALAKPGLKRAPASASSIAARPWLLALAAVIMVGLTIALRLATAPDPRPFDMVDGRAEVPGASLVVNDGPYMLQMSDDLQIPLYPQMDVNPSRLAGYPREFDPRVRQQLLDAGYELQPDVRYITGNAPDGRPFIVPVQQFRIQSTIQ